MGALVANMTTNYINTFISVAPDCPVVTAEVPLPRAGRETIATLQFRLMVARPYELTSDDLLFEVFARRRGISPDDTAAQRGLFFAKEQPCLRSSPLCKRYGWGIHHDAKARVALYPVESDEYKVMLDDASLTHLRAMRSRRGQAGGP
jgi:Family of unknown function (DUF6157)